MDTSSRFPACPTTRPRRPPGSAVRDRGQRLHAVRIVRVVEQHANAADVEQARAPGVVAVALAEGREGPGAPRSLLHPRHHAASDAASAFATLCIAEPPRASGPRRPRSDRTDRGPAPARSAQRRRWPTRAPTRAPTGWPALASTPNHATGTGGGSARPAWCSTASSAFSTSRPALPITFPTVSFVAASSARSLMPYSPK